MKGPSSVEVIQVGLDFGKGKIPVGRLARSQGTIYFAYESDFLERWLEISPFHLPLKPGVSAFDRFLFEGLPGVFHDSLPDGWGRLLLDRYVRSQGADPKLLTALDRLSWVGKQGLGALVYEPGIASGYGQEPLDLDLVASAVQQVLEGTAEDVLEQLLSLGGSSAGARPKALVNVSQSKKNIIHGLGTPSQGFAPWLVKFPTRDDGLDAGAIEYVYALMAKDAGVEMPHVHLFPAHHGPGYFATMRFDRDGDSRFHMHTAAGLLHTDFRTPALDYQDLLALTFHLTRDIREVEKMYRLAVFNVLAHNRDDHAKNFSFLMNEQGEWKFAPAYDLTFSFGVGGEQSTMVMGEGRYPKAEHLLKLGIHANLGKPQSARIIEQTQAALDSWAGLARQYGVADASIQRIAKEIGP